MNHRRKVLLLLILLNNFLFDDGLRTGENKTEVPVLNHDFHDSMIDRDFSIIPILDSFESWFKIFSKE